MAPKITKKSKSKVTVVEGNALYLVCEAKGVPTPFVSWRKIGERVLQSNMNITYFVIDDASKDNAGKYECKVSNPVGTVRHTMEITIIGKLLNISK